MTLKSTVFALPLITMASMGAAQNVEYLSYGAGITGGDADAFSLGGTIDYRNSNFVFNGGVSYVDPDGGDEATTLDFRAGYFITPNAVLYAGFDYDDDDAGSLDSYNIGGEYKFGQFTVGLNFEDTDESGVDTSSAIYGGYQATNELEFGLLVSDQDSDTLTVLSADYDLGDTELFAAYIDDGDDTEIFAFNGNYDFGNGFRAGGGYADIDSAVDAYSISGGYEVAESLWVDLSLSRLDTNGGGDADVIGLAISFETGRETLLINRIETAVAQSLNFARFGSF